MQMSDPSGAEPPRAREKLRLKVAEGNAAGAVLEVEDELVIGRQASGDGTLGNDIEISRRHARIMRGSDGRYVIEDLGSTNGTYLNGRRIESATALEPGDRIEMGATALIVQVGALPPTPAHGTEVPIDTDPSTTPAPVSADAPVADSADAEPLEGDPGESLAPDSDAGAAASMDADPAAVEAEPAAAPSADARRISLRIELDLEEKKATVALDEDSEEIQLVLDDGRWRVE